MAYREKVGSFKNTDLVFLVLIFISGQFGLDRFSLDINIQVRFILFPIMLVFLIWRLNQNNRSLKYNFSVLVFIIFFFFYLVTSLISLFYSPDISKSIYKFFDIFVIFVLSIVILIILKDNEPDVFFKTTSYVFIGIGLILVIPIYMNVLQGSLRGSTGLGGPNVATRIMFFCTICSYYLFQSNRSNKYLILSIIFFGSTFLLGSRGGLVSAFIAFFYLMVSRLCIVIKARKRQIIFRPKIISVLFIGLFIFLYMYDYLKNIILLRYIHGTFTHKGIYTSGRDIIYKNSFKMIEDYPVIGSGLDGYAIIYDSMYPHNLILELATDLGLIGFLFSFMAIASVLFVALKYIRTKYALFSSCVIYILFAQMFSGGIYDFRYYFFWIIPLLFYKNRISP